MSRADAWGRIALDPTSAFSLAYAGHDVWGVPSPRHPLIDQFNSNCRRFGKDEFQIDELTTPTHTPEEEHERRASTWLISDEIKSIPVREFLTSLCKTEDEITRVNHEMDLFEERDLIPLLQLMMYLIDHFRRNKIVWGVGRGSSVSSYVLYLIGVHKIDSIRYGLDVRDFLKEGENDERSDAAGL